MVRLSFDVNELKKLENNSIFTVISIYKGQTLSKLELSYGKLNFLAPASGMGKTVLGIFLRDESFRRMGIVRTGRAFIPKVDWELLINGPFGLVEMITPEEGKGKLVDYLNIQAPLEGLFKRKGKYICPYCNSKLSKVEDREFVEDLRSLQCEFLLLGLRVRIDPQTVLATLDWSRKEAISRILIDGEIRKLPDSPKEDGNFSAGLFSTSNKEIEAVLLREVVSSSSLDSSLYKTVGDLLSLSEIAKTVFREFIEPILLAGSIAVDKVRAFHKEKELKLSTPFVCLECGEGFHELPESKIDGLTLSQVQQMKLNQLINFFENNFGLDWFRIYELKIENLHLNQSVEEIPFELLLELKLLSLCLLEARDTIIYVDATLTSKSKIFAVELTRLGNAIVAHSREGQSLEQFLPSDFRRPSEKLSKQEEVKAVQRRNSIEPLIVECGIEKMVSELYASLPEARVRNLTTKELSFHAAKCPDCGGAGSTIVGIGTLGKRAEVCKTCFGSRYQEMVSFVSYQEVNLPKLLELTVLQASSLFSKRAEIVGHLSHLEKQGLANYRLGDEWRTLPSKARSVLDQS